MHVLIGSILQAQLTVNAPVICKVREGWGFDGFYTEEHPPKSLWVSRMSLSIWVKLLFSLLSFPGMGWNQGSEEWERCLAFISLACTVVY